MPEQNETAPGLRERIAEAIREWHGDWNKATFAEAADAVLAVVQPVIDQLAEDAAIARRAQWDQFRSVGAELRTHVETAEATIARVRETVARDLPLIRFEMRDEPSDEQRGWVNAMAAVEAALTPPAPADQTEGGAS